MRAIYRIRSSRILRPFQFFRLTKRSFCKIGVFGETCDGECVSGLVVCSEIEGFECCRDELKGEVELESRGKRGIVGLCRTKQAMFLVA